MRYSNVFALVLSENWNILCAVFYSFMNSKWKCHFSKRNFFNKILFLLLKWKVNLLKFLQRWNLEMDFYTVDMVESAQIHNKTRTKQFSFTILFGQVEIMKYFKWFWYGCWLWKVYQKCCFNTTDLQIGYMYQIFFE